MSASVDAELKQLWTRGVVRADAERLNVLTQSSTHERRPELAAFATVAEMIAGGSEALPEGLLLSPDAQPCARVLGLAAKLWLSAARRQGSKAVRRLDVLEHALGELGEDPADVLATAIADLAIADCAIVTNQPDVARERLLRVARDDSVPHSARVNARIALATRVMHAANEGKRAATILATAGDVADEQGLVVEAAHCRLYGALVALASGDPATRRRASGWLDKIPAAAPDGYHALSAAVRAMASPGEQGYIALADGLRRATEHRDFAAYWLLISFGARRYRDDGDDLSALVTLINGMGQLNQVDPSGILARPLDQQLKTMRDELGVQQYEALLRAAEQVIVRDAGHVGG